MNTQEIIAAIQKQARTQEALENQLKAEYYYYAATFNQFPVKDGQQLDAEPEYLLLLGAFLALQKLLDSVNRTTSDFEPCYLRQPIPPILLNLLETHFGVKFSSLIGAQNGKQELGGMPLSATNYHLLIDDDANKYKRLYLLTDGQVVDEFRFLTAQEADELNQKAMQATDGNWWWVAFSPDENPSPSPQTLTVYYSKKIAGDRKVWVVSVKKASKKGLDTCLLEAFETLKAAHQWVGQALIEFEQEMSRAQ